MASASRSRLLEVFKQRAVSFGHFRLASGKESTYYINSKKALFNSEAVWLLGDVLWELTKDLNIAAIGGLEVGAIPMAAAAAMRYHENGRPLEGFFVRKQAKGHGSQERVEGVLPPGARIAVIDDVLTTGGSVEQALAEVERAGAKVVAVICIVDRLEGCANGWPRATTTCPSSPFATSASSRWCERSPDFPFLHNRPLVIVRRAGGLALEIHPGMGDRYAAKLAVRPVLPQRLQCPDLRADLAAAAAPRLRRQHTGRQRRAGRVHGRAGAGRLVFGRRADQTARPLRLYAWLEAGIAATALLVPSGFAILTSFYTSLHARLEPSPWGSALLRLALALVVLLLPATLIGATLPVMARLTVRRATRLPASFSLLYGVNTLGAVLGAALTGFVFLRFLGMTQTLWLAVGLNLIVAVVAGIAAWRQTGEESPLLNEPEGSVLSTQYSVLSTPPSRFGLVALACAAATGASTWASKSSGPASWASSHRTAPMRSPWC